MKTRKQVKAISGLFLVLIGKFALGEETGELCETKRIKKGSLKPLHQNALSKEKATNKQIDDEAFRAYKCEEENVLTAMFSSNPPPECRKEDGSAYYKPIEKKAKLLELESEESQLKSRHVW